MKLWLALALGACHVAPDYSRTHYQCTDGVCPSGFSCISGFCESRDGGLPGMDADASTLPWWDPAYTKRARLTITDVSTTPLGAGFQIGVYVDLGKLDSPSASWNSLRVVRFDPMAQSWTESSRYTQGPSSTRTVWFKLDAAVGASEINTDYWLYFGNPSPPGTSNDGSVFDFFDGFDGTAVDAASWVVQGTPAPIASELQVKPNDSVRSMFQVAPGHAITASMTAPPAKPRFWFGFQRQTDFDDSPPWLVWINRATGDSDAPPGSSDATIWPETLLDTMQTSPSWGPASQLDGQKHWYTIERFDDRLVFKYEEQTVYDFALGQSLTTPLQIRLANEGSVDISFAMLDVRQAVYPDPGVAIGPTQTQ